MSEIYISTDIESDGPIPGQNSMLSFGSAAFAIEDGKAKLVSTFSANLETLEGAVGDPDTMKWWATQKGAWEACRKDLLAARGRHAEVRLLVPDPVRGREPVLLLGGRHQDLRHGDPRLRGALQVIHEEGSTMFLMYAFAVQVDDWIVIFTEHHGSFVYGADEVNCMPMDPKFTPPRKVKP